MRLLGRPSKGWLRDPRFWVVAAFLVYTVAGFLAVPRILRAEIPRLVRTYTGRESTVAAASFNPFTLVTVLRGFELRDRDGSPLASFDALELNLDVSGLFRRAWTIGEIHLVHPTVIARILPNGRLAIADLLEKKADPAQRKQPFRMPRALIRQFRVESGKLTFRDESVTPAFETFFDPLSLAASGLTTIPERSGDHVVSIGLEHGKVRWAGRMSTEPLRFEGQIDVAFTEFRRVADYVAHAYPMRMASGPVHLVLPYVVEMRAGGGLRAELHDVALDISALRFRPRDTDDDWVRLGSIGLKGGRVRWPEQTAEAELLRISEPAVKAWRAADGKLNWASFAERFTAEGAAATAGSAGPASRPWSVSCAAVEIAGGSVDVEDRTLSPPQEVAVSGIAARFTGVGSDASAPVTADVAAKINGAGTMAARGTVTLKPAAADLDVEAAGVELAAFQASVSRLARITLRSGAAGVRGKAVYRDGGKPLLRFDGRATLDRLAIDDPEGARVLSWDGMAVDDIWLTLDPNFVRAKTVSLAKPFARVLIDRQGRIGDLELVRSPSSGESAEPVAPAVVSSAHSPFPFEIGAIRLHGGTVDYADESLILPFATKIHDAEGSVNDLSSRSAAGSHLLVEGKVDEHGYAKAEGTLRVMDPYDASDIRVRFRNVEMSRLTPYTAEFAGYAIKDGRLDLDVDYQLHERRLVGNHRLTAVQLTLGDKVEGAPSNLPLRLAVALLKDAQGKIELEVPIEGSVDDPEFGYRKVVWGAVKRVLVNVTTAPFKFLGRLMGVEGHDLESVSFEAGRSALLPPEKEKLAKLVEGMKSRPVIALQVGGRFDPGSDADALRHDKLEAQVAARRETMAAGAADDGEAVLDRALEALYDEAYSIEQRNALRQQHTSAPATPPADAAVKHGRKEPSPPEGTFDGAGYFEDLRKALVQAQNVAPDELAALARARSDAIVAALTGDGAIDAARITASAIEPIKKNKGGEGLVACDLSMPAD